MTGLEIWITLGIVLVLVVLSFLFSGTETAVTAASRARLHAQAEAGDGRATAVERLVARKDRLVSALLIGNNLVNILASALATSIMLPLFGAVGVAYATLGLTVVLVIFCEILPKSLALVRPERFAMTVSSFARLVSALFGPLASLINRFVRWLLSLFGGGLGREEELLTAHEELRGAVALLHREGAVVKHDRDRMGGLLDLAELEVSDVMVHRTNMLSVDADDLPQMVVREILLGSHTRVPVWKGSSENIVGVVHAKDLMRALDEVGNDYSRIDILKVAAKPWFVPDTTALHDQLNAFLRRKAHFAIVVDEYGEVQGLVTLEDILEEIVGDIADEHDVAVKGVRQEADGSVVVEGTVTIRDLNRALDWKLPDEEATTVAGLVIHESQIIPKERQAFTFHGKRFIVMKRDKNRITRIRIRPADEG